MCQNQSGNNGWEAQKSDGNSYNEEMNINKTAKHNREEIQPKSF